MLSIGNMPVNKIKSLSSRSLCGSGTGPLVGTGSKQVRCGICWMVEKNKAEKGGGFWDGVAVLNHVILPGKVTDLKGTPCTSVGRACPHREGPSGWRRGRQGGPGVVLSEGSRGPASTASSNLALALRWEVPIRRSLAPKLL